MPAGWGFVLTRYPVSGFLPKPFRKLCLLGLQSYYGPKRFTHSSRCSANSQVVSGNPNKTGVTILRRPSRHGQIHAEDGTGSRHPCWRCESTASPADAKLTYSHYGINIKSPSHKESDIALETRASAGICSAHYTQRLNLRRSLP